MSEWEAWPQYTEEHSKAVEEVIKSNQLFASGKVAQFEESFAEYTGSKHCLGLGNATQGLHLALASLGIGRGDEVIVTPYSWISSASCVLMQGAIPVFADIEPISFGLDPSEVEKAITARTKAVIVVHMFGYCSDIEPLVDVCKRHGVYLIEDASHAHGASLNGRKLGTFGDIGIWSLHQRKALSVGDGGMFATNSKEVSDRVYGLRSFGDKQLSFNYRMTEFAAALGIIGLKNLDQENLIRSKNHNLLRNTLSDVTQIKFVDPRPHSVPVYYSNLMLISGTEAQKNELLASCALDGIPLKRTWQPLHKHSHFQRSNMPKCIAPWDIDGLDYIEPNTLDLPNSKRYQEGALFELDCHPFVSEENILRACDIIKKSFLRS